MELPLPSCSSVGSAVQVSSIHSHRPDCRTDHQVSAVRSLASRKRLPSSLLPERKEGTFNPISLPRDPLTGKRCSLIVYDLPLVLPMLSETSWNKAAMQRAGEEHSRKREQELESPEERMNRVSVRNGKETSVMKAGFSKLFLQRAS